MTTIQHRVRLVDHRGPSGRRVEIAPGGGDEDLVILEARRPRFNDTPVEVQLLLPRKDLLAALGAEPDETDYREVVEENDRLGRSVNRRASEARRVRTALGLPSSATVEDVLDAIRAAEAPRDDQDSIDRSWALEKAGEVLGRLAAVGALPKDRAGVPVVALAAWILDGEPVDRG